MPQGKITSQYRQRGGLHVILLSRSPYLYIYGTVRVGERSERVEYSTELHHEMPGAWDAAATMLLIKEKEILERPVYDRERKSVGSGKSVYARGAFGCHRILNKQN